MPNIIKFIRGAEASLPILNQGEPAFTTDTHKVFIGDGAENHQLAMITDISGIDKTNWVYPQDYATGTGTAIDPWAGDCMDDAYTACPTGGTIYLRAGYYLLDNTLTIHKAINIIGEGINKTFIVTAVASHGIALIEANNITLKGFTIDGTAQTGGAGTSVINIDKCHYNLLEDIELKEGSYYGLNVYQVNYSVFQNIWSHDQVNIGLHAGTNAAAYNQYNTYRNIYVWNNGSGGFDDRGTGESGAPIENCYNVYDNINSWGNTGDGIFIGGVNNASLTNSTMTGNGSYGLHLAGLDYFSISNCEAYLNATNGMRLSSLDNTNFTNCIVQNNDRSGVGATGIRMQDSTNITFTSCQSFDERVVVGADIAFVDGGGGADTITMTSARFLKEGFIAGKDITITGAGEAGNNDTFTIVSVVAGTITLATGTLVAEGAGATVTITHEASQNYGIGLYTINTGISLLNCKLSPNATGEIYNDGAASTISVLTGVVGTSAPVVGDIQYHNGTNWVRLAKGTAGQVLEMNSGATAPEWDTPLGGGDALKADGLDQFAATTSAELAGVISDETGSGLLVFGTSPTLVTPALGTPSAVVLTNASGTAASLTAGAATALANARTIGGVSFDGTANIVPTSMSIAGALGDDHTYLGITDSKNVGENVVFGDLLYFDWTATEWKKAKADAAGTTPAMRIALETKGNGESCLMLAQGYIRDDSAFEFAVAVAYLSITTAGAIQYAAPSVAGNQVQRIGVGISADILFFSPSIDVGEI